MGCKTCSSFGFAYILVLTTATAQQACYAPNGNAGYCVSSSECDYIKDIWAYYGSSIPSVTLAYIMQSRCIDSTSTLLFCCDTYTPPPFTTHVPKDIPSFRVPANYETSLDSSGVGILQEQRCGTIGYSARIANGVNANLSEFPWMALLRYNTTTDYYKCGGSLISNRYVLTAAHCLSKSTKDDCDLISVRLGEYDLNSTHDCFGLSRRKKCAPPVEDYGISEKLIHPSYDAIALTFEYDIGLIKLSQNVEFKKHIAPICLPITRKSADFGDDISFIVAGWGYTQSGHSSSVLQMASVTNRQLNVCQNIFTEAKLSDLFLCAGGDGDVDSCRGDSGGPLFQTAPYRPSIENPQYYDIRYVQFGIVSFGRIQCGGKTPLPGVYTNIVKLMPWITKTIGS